MHTTHEQHVSEGCLCWIYYILDSIVAFAIFMSFGGHGDPQSKSLKQNRKNIVVHGWFQHKFKIFKKIANFFEKASALLSKI